MYVCTYVYLSVCVRACVRVCVCVHVARVGRMRAWRSEEETWREARTKFYERWRACAWSRTRRVRVRVRVRVRMRARPSVRRCGVTAEPYSSPGNNARSPCNSDTVNANRSPSTANCHASLASETRGSAGRRSRSRSVAMPDSLEFLPPFCARACSIGVWWTRGFPQEDHRRRLRIGDRLRERGSRQERTLGPLGRSVPRRLSLSLSHTRVHTCTCFQSFPS